MALRFAYNTNGAANHRFGDALALISDAGYDGVALTLDHHHFDPLAPGLAGRADELAALLSRLGLGCVIETGARFLLDPRAKHEPTLLSPEPEGRALRVRFLERAIDVAAACGAEAVSFWAGVARPEVTRAAGWDHLVDGLTRVTEYAARRGVVCALEPEPGMLVETIDDYLRAKEFAPALRLALDTGHCLVTGDRDPAAAVREMRGEIGTAAIEDMRRGRHEHLPFGEGEMDVAGVLAAFGDINFTNLVCVELSRESHRAHTMVFEALRFLREAERRTAAQASAAMQG